MQQRLELMMGAQQIQRPEQSMALLLERHGRNLRSVLVSSVIDCVRELVVPILNEHGQLKHSATGRSHLVARLAEQVVYAGGNDLMRDFLTMMLSEDRDAADTLRQVTTLTNEEVASAFAGHAGLRTFSWDELRTLLLTFVSKALEAQHAKSGIDLMEAVINHPLVFAKSVVQQWQENASEYIPALQSAAHDLYQHQEHPSETEDQVPELLKELRMHFPHRTQRSFDVVRTATFREGNEHDLDQIVEMYRSALLTDDVLRLLLPRTGDTEESIQKRMDLFRTRIHKGVFVRDVNRDQLLNEMGGEAAQAKGMKLHFDVLETQDPEIIRARGHGILAFGSHYKPFWNESSVLRERRYRTMEDYLRKGESGGKPHFDGGMETWLNERIPELLPCGDIRSTYAYAADRFAPLAFEAAQQREQGQTYVLAYRLRHLGVSSSVPLVRDIEQQGILWENDSSYELTRPWGLKHIGEDQNPSTFGKHIRTIIVDGQSIELNPTWEITGGSFGDVIRQSREAWEKIQRKHGDVSTDRVEKLWKFYR